MSVPNASAAVTLAAVNKTPDSDTATELDIKQSENLNAVSRHAIQLSDTDS